MKAAQQAVQTGNQLLDYYQKATAEKRFLGNHTTLYATNAPIGAQTFSANTLFSGEGQA